MRGLKEQNDAKPYHGMKKDNLPKQSLSFVIDRTGAVEGQFDSDEEDFNTNVIIHDRKATGMEQGTQALPDNATVVSQSSSSTTSSSAKSFGGQSHSTLSSKSLSPHREPTSRTITRPQVETIFETPNQVEFNASKKGQLPTTSDGLNQNFGKSLRKDDKLIGGHAGPHEPEMLRPEDLFGETNFWAVGTNETDQISHASESGFSLFSNPTDLERKATRKPSPTLTTEKPSRKPEYRLTNAPKAELYSMYGKDRFRKALCAADYITWNNNGPPHNMRFTSVFVCPITGETFASGSYGTEKTPQYEWKDEFCWYPTKKLAEHAAAARAYDCLSFRNVPAGQSYYYIGNDEPYHIKYGKSLNTSKIPHLERQLIEEAKKRAPNFDPAQEV